MWEVPLHQFSPSQLLQKWLIVNWNTFNWEWQHVSLTHLRLNSSLFGLTNSTQLNIRFLLLYSHQLLQQPANPTLEWNDFFFFTFPLWNCHFEHHKNLIDYKRRMPLNNWIENKIEFKCDVLLCSINVCTPSISISLLSRWIETNCIGWMRVADGVGFEISSLFSASSGSSVIWSENVVESGIGWLVDGGDDGLQVDLDCHQHVKLYSISFLNLL